MRSPTKKENALSVHRPPIVALEHLYSQLKDLSHQCRDFTAPTVYSIVVCANSLAQIRVKEEGGEGGGVQEEETTEQEKEELFVISLHKVSLKRILGSIDCIGIYIMSFWVTTIRYVSNVHKYNTEARSRRDDRTERQQEHAAKGAYDLPVHYCIALYSCGLVVNQFGSNNGIRFRRRTTTTGDI